MDHNNTDIEKSIGRNYGVSHAPGETTQDLEAEGYPGIEYIIPPDVDDKNRATAVFKNGGKWRFVRTETGQIKRESIYPDGNNCESRIDETADYPMEELQNVLQQYSTRGASWLNDDHPDFLEVLG